MEMWNSSTNLSIGTPTFRPQQQKMKALLLVSLFISSCFASKTRVGCGDWRDVQRHDRSKFHVQKTVRTGVGWYVQIKRKGEKPVSTFCYCENLPDSVAKGHYITLILK
jgi:hypothetical protein